MTINAQWVISLIHTYIYIYIYIHKGQYKKYGFFTISHVQIFALYKGQKLPQA